jgi:hypothetical protein
MLNRIRDLAIEVGIAVGVVCLVVFFAIFKHDHPHARFEFRWIGVGVWTALAFGYPLVALRAYWRRPLFWLLFGALLAMHLIAYKYLLQRPGVDMASLVIFVMTMIEMRALAAILDRVMSLSYRSKG